MTTLTQLLDKANAIVKAIEEDGTLGVHNPTGSLNDLDTATAQKVQILAGMLEVAGTPGPPGEQGPPGPPGEPAPQWVSVVSIIAIILGLIALIIAAVAIKRGLSIIKI